MQDHPGLLDLVTESGFLRPIVTLFAVADDVIEEEAVVAHHMAGKIGVARIEVGVLNQVDRPFSLRFQHQGLALAALHRKGNPAFRFYRRDADPPDALSFGHCRWRQFERSRSGFHAERHFARAPSVPERQIDGLLPCVLGAPEVDCGGNLLDRNRVHFPRRHGNCSPLKTAHNLQVPKISGNYLRLLRQVLPN